MRVKPQINDGLALCRPYLHRSWLVLFVLQPGRNGTARGTEAKATWGRLGAASPWAKPTRWVPMKRFSCRDFAPCGREGFQEKGEGGGLILRCVLHRGIEFEDDNEDAYGWNGEEDAVGVIRG